MHLDGRTRLRLGTAANRSFRWLAVLFPVSIVGSVLGQGYLVPPQGFQGAPAVPAMGNVSSTSGTAPKGGGVTSQNIDQFNSLANGEPISPLKGQPNAQPKDQATPPAEGEPSGSISAPLTAPLTSLMSWGSVHLHAQASYQFLYDSGIHTAPGVSTETITHTITPGLSLDLGPHVNVSYTPSFRFYSQKDFHNTVDHAATLSAGVHVGDWTIGTSHSLTISDDPLVETSSQTQQKAYSGGLFASYQVNDKISLSTTAGIGLNFVGNSTNVFVGGSSNAAPSQLSDSKSYSGSEWLDYEFNERVTAGVGVTIAYSEQSGGIRSIDQQYNGRFSWRPGKLSVSLTAGLEHQNFLGVKTTDSWNPIYSASIGYQLFEQTALSLSANRSVNTSLFQNQVSESTTVGVGLQQRLLGKLHMSLGFGYSKSDFKSATANLATSRSDEGTSYSAGLSLPFLTSWSAATFYQYTQSSSSQGGFGYSSSQVGATLSWTY